MVSQHAYLLFIGLVAIERLVELVVARRHAAWSFARGGREFGAGHYPVMVLIHTGLLIGAPA
jgi:methyltransferase